MGANKASTVPNFCRTLIVLIFRILGFELFLYCYYINGQYSNFVDALPSCKAREDVLFCIDKAKANVI